MPGHTSSPSPAETPQPPPSTAPTPAEQSVPAAPAVEDRSELVQRARAFLTSPQVQYEDLAAKRRFLLDKGLNDAEVEALLRDVVRMRSMSCKACYEADSDAAATSTSNSATNISAASAVQPAEATRGHIQDCNLGSGRVCCPALGILCTSLYRISRASIVR